MYYASLLLPDFSLILIGFALCRLTPLNRSVWEPVERLVYYLLFPVLLFHAIIKSPLVLGESARFLGAGLLCGLGAIALAYLLPWLPWMRSHIDRRQHAAGAQVAFRFNSFIGLALAERLAGATGLQQMAMLIGCCVPLMNIAAVWPMARHGQTHFLRALASNPLIIATLSGLLVNLAGLHPPTWSLPVLDRISACAVGLGLMAAGAGMRVTALARDKALAIALLSLRHLAQPLLAFGLARAFELDAARSAILLTFSALPTASSAYVLAARMGYDGAFVAALVTLSTVLGTLSLPFALSLIQ